MIPLLAGTSVLLAFMWRAAERRYQTILAKHVALRDFIYARAALDPVQAVEAVIAWGPPGMNTKALLHEAVREMRR